MIVDKMEILNHVSGTVKGSKIKALRKLKKKKKKIHLNYLQSAERET